MVTFMSTTNFGSTLELRSLSADVLLYIMTFLDGQDIVMLSRTNRTLFNLYKKSPSLQSLVQLDICGAEACIGSLNFDSRERLSYMIARESLWLRMAGSHELAFTRKNNRGPPARLSGSEEGGIYWYGLAYAPGPEPELGEVTLEARAVRAFQYSRNGLEASWRTFTVSENSDEFEVVHACLAVQEHDLIAVFTLPLEM